MPQLSRLNIFLRVGGLDRSGIGSTVELTSPEPANALIESLRNVIGAADVRPRWLNVGLQLIAVDTLVHNFLHRTGILSRFEAAHPYGQGCYRPGGCADIIRLLASRIDARQFNRAFLQVFPRFVQLAIWRYCSEAGIDICNGNRLDDQYRCHCCSEMLHKLCANK